MKHLFLFSFLFFYCGSLSAQIDSTGDNVIYYGKTLSPAEVKAEMQFLNDTAAYKYRQYQHYIKTVWPYVQEATVMMDEIDQKLSQNISNSEKRKFIKAKEKEFKNKFEIPIKSLNVNQGKILVKLINRQLGSTRTLYNSLAKLKGAPAAVKWQLWAKANGMNLNEVYNKNEEIRIESMLRRLGYVEIEYIDYQSE